MRRKPSPPKRAPRAVPLSTLPREVQPIVLALIRAQERADGQKAAAERAA